MAGRQGDRVRSRAPLLWVVGVSVILFAGYHIHRSTRIAKTPAHWLEYPHIEAIGESFYDEIAAFVGDRTCTLAFETGS